MNAHPYPADRDPVCKHGDEPCAACGHPPIVMTVVATPRQPMFGRLEQRAHIRSEVRAADDRARLNEGSPEGWWLPDLGPVTRFGPADYAVLGSIMVTVGLVALAAWYFGAG